METYREFLDRINSFQKSEIDFGNEYFSGNPSITQKVNKENVFRAFYGDTVVFNLDDSTKEKLTKIVNQENLKSVFSARFTVNTASFILMKIIM